ncbi:MAG: hypothetical protein JW850_14000 [Thermoflexales bacterium]|nr:hypothetical protein [Thermoflexales bacterium]
MQTFVCPDCGHKSEYDPWIEPAHCPQCGYKPPVDAPLRNQPPSTPKIETHRPFLAELVAHWNGMHTPDRSFTLRTPQDALAFFQTYQEAMGKVSGLPAAGQYQPAQEEILGFVGAYLLLRRGERAQAAQRFQALVHTAPKYIDAWIWWSATADEPAKRIDRLEEAVLLDPAHPLARDALAAAQGKS